MKTNNIILAALALAALVSCQKEEPSSRNNPAKGVEMTLTANLPATKVSVTDDALNGVLKTSWDANDEMSVVTINDAGQILTIDTFVSKGEAGAASTVFSGTFTGNPSNEIHCFYPAVKGPNEAGRYYSSNGYYYMKISGDSINITDPDVFQSANNDPSYLNKYLVFSGQANYSEGEISVALKPRQTLLKVTLPAADWNPETIKSLVISSSEINFARVGWSYVFEHDSKLVRGAMANQIRTELGTDLYTFMTTPAGKVIVYLFNNAPISVVSGTTWTFSLNSSDPFPRKIEKTFSAARSLSEGKCYNIDLSSESWSIEK